MDAFKDSASALVADVDCTVEEDICSNNGVEGYPTIKHGPIDALKDYEGGREYDDLLTFAKENLGPTCGPQNLDLCSAEQKKEITEVQALTDDEIMAKLKAKDEEAKAIEAAFSEATDKLQAEYEKLNKEKEAKIAGIKDSNQGTLLSICKDRPSCTPPLPPPSPEGEEAEEEPEPDEDDKDGADEPPMDDEAEEEPAEEPKADTDL